MAANPESLGFTPYELVNDLEGFKRSIASKLAYTVGKDSSNATRQDWYAAMCLALNPIQKIRFVPYAHARFRRFRAQYAVRFGR